jgi:prepilin-type N-terminal cleavage/methylation domain-containing protein/prepilin-type processing-associated H-X9-DG protein
LKRRAGFTILELLTVMGIVSILLAVLLPAVQTAREAARNQQCVSHLRQVGLALHCYHDVHRTLPPGWRRDAQRDSAFGWAAMLLPFLDQQNLHAEIDFQGTLSGGENLRFEDRPLEIYNCPSDIGVPSFQLFAEKDSHSELQSMMSTDVVATLPRANYVGVFGNSDPDAVPGDVGEGVFLEDRSVSLYMLRQGTSRVALVGERTTRKLPSTWLGIVMEGEDAPGRVTGNLLLGPNRADADECELDSRHPGHVNFVWGDGHAGAVADGVDGGVYRGFARRFRVYTSKNS